MRQILGFNNTVYGPYNNAPITVLGDNVASFNQVNYFLIHSDLCTKGIRFNNAYNQTISQVLIDAPPGSQIVSKPFNPSSINCQDLAGAIRNNIKMWITDDKNRRINMNNEYWSCRIVIKYLKPFIISNDNSRKTY